MACISAIMNYFFSARFSPVFFIYVSICLSKRSRRSLNVFNMLWYSWGPISFCDRTMVGGVWSSSEEDNEEEAGWCWRWWWWWWFSRLLSEKATKSSAAARSSLVVALGKGEGNEVELLVFCWSGNRLFLVDVVVELVAVAVACGCWAAARSRRFSIASIRRTSPSTVCSICVIMSHCASLTWFLTNPSMVVADACSVCMSEEDRLIWSSKVDFNVRVVSMVSNKCSKGCRYCWRWRAANELVVGVFGGKGTLAAVTAIWGCDSWFLLPNVAAAALWGGAGCGLLWGWLPYKEGDAMYCWYDMFSLLVGCAVWGGCCCEGTIGGMANSWRLGEGWWW